MAESTDVLLAKISTTLTGVAKDVVELKVDLKEHVTDDKESFKDVGESFKEITKQIVGESKENPGLIGRIISLEGFRERMKDKLKTWASVIAAVFVALISIAATAYFSR